MQLITSVIDLEHDISLARRGKYLKYDSISGNLHQFCACLVSSANTFRAMVNRVILIARVGTWMQSGAKRWNERSEERRQSKSDCCAVSECLLSLLCVQCQSKESLHHNHDVLVFFSVFSLLFFPPSFAHFNCCTNETSLYIKRVAIGRHWLLFSSFFCTWWVICSWRRNNFSIQTSKMTLSDRLPQLLFNFVGQFEGKRNETLR